MTFIPQICAEAPSFWFSVFILHSAKGALTPVFLDGTPAGPYFSFNYRLDYTSEPGKRLDPGSYVTFYDIPGVVRREVSPFLLSVRRYFPPVSHRQRSRLRRSHAVECGLDLPGPPGRNEHCFHHLQPDIAG